MASVFWDVHGAIFMDYVQKEWAITGAYYAALLDRLVDEIRKKCTHLKKKNPFFMMKSTVSSRPSPQRLLSVPKPQEIAV